MTGKSRNLIESCTKINKRERERERERERKKKRERDNYAEKNTRKKLEAAYI